jgi:hypothetical protein
MEMSDQVDQETGEVTAMIQSEQQAPAAAALQAASIATVQARVLMALKRPRDVEAFRVKLLKECARPGFADAAIFSLPRGGKTIEGPSIRLAESCARLFGNLLIEAQVVSEDDENRVLRVMATDLETNTTDYQDVVVAKTIERKDPRGRDVLRTRRNSEGAAVYIVRATEDEMLQKTNSGVSKMRRNKILSLIPADILEEAVSKCNATLKDRDGKDPDAARKQLVDAFAQLGVQPADLREWLGHDLDRLQPAELSELRAAFNTVRQGEMTWSAMLEIRKPTEASEKGKPQSGKAERLEKELTGKVNDG